MKNSETNNIQSHSRNTVLCDGFLIPMTDFVLKSNEWRKQWEIPIEVQERNNQSYRNILNYAKFLKQPLKLEMFVPCDEEGNILGEPKTPHTFSSENSDEYVEKWKLETEIYNKAKEKVLFENTSIREINYFINHFQKIEDLFSARGGKTLKLSQAALNAIFG